MLREYLRLSLPERPCCREVMLREDLRLSLPERPCCREVMLREDLAALRGTTAHFGGQLCHAGRENQSRGAHFAGIRGTTTHPRHPNVPRAPLGAAFQRRVVVG